MVSQGEPKGRSVPLETVGGEDQLQSVPLPLRLSPTGARSARDQDRATILLVDPRPLTRECIYSWLAANSWEFRVLPYATVTDFTRQEAPGEDRVHLVVLNIDAARMSDLRVLEDIDRLNRRLPEVPIVMLADLEESSHIIQALHHGVRGYIPTTLRPRVAIQAIRLVLAGGTFVPAKALVECSTEEKLPAPANRFRQAIIESFTPRQSEVLRHLREGKSNKAIAYELDMCESTVKVHVRHIMRKLKATNRTQVAFLLNQLTDIDPKTAGTREPAAEVSDR